MLSKYKALSKSISFILILFMLFNLIGAQTAYATNNSNEVMTPDKLKEHLNQPKADNNPITLKGEFTIDNVHDSINPINFYFNSKGLNEKVIDPNGNITLYEYDENNKLKKTIAKGNDGSIKLVTTYSYNDLGRISTLRTEDSSGKVIADFIYEYNKHGNSTLQKDNISGNYVEYKYKKIKKIKEDRYYALESEKYYDSNGKLINRISYKYDNSGNRTAKDMEEKTDKKNKEKIKYDYNNNNQLIAKDKENIYVYDNNGNLTFDENNTNDFNESNQLAKSINTNNNTVLFNYNENGLRTKKISNSGTYNYHYSGNKLIWITDGDNNLKYFFTRDGEENLLNMIDYTGDNPKTYWYVFDEHQNVVGMVDENSKKVVSYEYDAWGNITKSEGNTLTGDGKLLREENPFRYSSYQYDEETEYYYLNARYYSPEIGRFLSKDSYNDHTDDPVNQNLYLYCINNPVNYYDESGHIYLTVGSTGEDVITLQAKLQKLGHLVMPEGVEYGYYGSLTKNAVTSFQQSKSELINDGVVGDKTWNALIAPGEFYLAYGSTGYKVELLQQRLEVLGYHDFNTLGYFGPVTLDAVNRYKEGFNLGNSKPLYYGLVGDTTWNSLFWNQTWNKKLADSKLNLEKLGYDGIRNSQGAIDKEWSTTYNLAIWDFRYRYNKNQEFIDNGSDVQLLYSWIQDAAEGNLTVNAWIDKVMTAKYNLEILGYNVPRNTNGVFDETWSGNDLFDQALWAFMDDFGLTSLYNAYTGDKASLLFSWIQDAVDGGLVQTNPSPVYVYDPWSWETEFQNNISPLISTIPTDIPDAERTSLVDAIIIIEAMKLQDKYELVYNQSSFFPWNWDLNSTLSPLYEQYPFETRITNKYAKAALEGFLLGVDVGIWYSAFTSWQPSSTKLTVDDIIDNPKSVWGKSAEEIAETFTGEGYIVNIDRSTQGSRLSTIVRIEGMKGPRTINTIQVHPGGGRHRLSYIKIKGNNVSYKVVGGTPTQYVGNYLEEKAKFFWMGE